MYNIDLLRGIGDLNCGLVLEVEVMEGYNKSDYLSLSCLSSHAKNNLVVISYGFEKEDIDTNPIDIYFPSAGKYIIELIGEFNYYDEPVFYFANGSSNAHDFIRIKKMIFGNKVFAGKNFSFYSISRDSKKYIEDVIIANSKFFEKTESIGTMFDEAWTSLNKIQSNMFDSAKNVINFRQVFNGSLLKTLPIGIFKNLKNITTVYGAFYNAKLEYIEEDLFKNSKKLEDITIVFNGCTELKHIPRDLFMSNININNVTSAFYNCNKLYNDKVKGYVPELWNLPLVKSGSGCFTGGTVNSTKTYNYNDIPKTTGWC